MDRRHSEYWCLTNIEKNTVATLQSKKNTKHVGKATLFGDGKRADYKVRVQAEIINAKVFTISKKCVSKEIFKKNQAVKWYIVESKHIKN